MSKKTNPPDVSVFGKFYYEITFLRAQKAWKHNAPYVGVIMVNNAICPFMLQLAN